MKTMEVRRHWSRSWRVGALLLAALALVWVGCDTDLEMEYADAGASKEEGQPSPGEVSEEGSTDEVAVTNLVLGRSLEGHKVVSRPSQRFHPHDTVFLGVIIRGTADDIWLTGRWYRGDEVVATTQHRSSPDGVEATEMHLSEGPDALPVGDYVVEVRLNETVVDSLPFQVVPEDEDLEQDPSEQ